MMRSWLQGLAIGIVVLILLALIHWRFKGLLWEPMWGSR